MVCFMPTRWIRAATARAMGTPKAQIPEALGEINTGQIAFDQACITYTRQSTGVSHQLRWDELAEISIHLTDTGPHEDDAYLVLADKHGAELRVVMGTEGVYSLLEESSTMHWFSVAQLDAAAAAIKGRSLRVSRFVLWSSTRDGLSIPAGLPRAVDPGSVTCDEHSLTYLRTPHKPLNLRWVELSALHMALTPSGYQLDFITPTQTISIPPAAEGLYEAIGIAKALPHLSHQSDQEALAVEHIRQCDLSTQRFTVLTAQG